MKNLKKLISIRFALAIAAGLAVSTVSSHAQSATATISGVAAGGGFNYTITLLNTGAFNLNDFWYGWTASGNNLPSSPTSPLNSLGWDNHLSGNSITWINSSGTALTPGHSATFTFASTATPTAITTPPSGGSVVYVGGITFTEDNPGDSSPEFSPVLVAAPEPSSLGLLMAGLFVLAGSMRIRALAALRK